ncbi:MAG: hypothetical protein QW331_01215 [Candidatus Woesearchaeota archaeon]
MKGIKNFLVLLLILIIACAQQTSQPIQTTECASDNDCVIVKEDCCGCQMGGQSKAIAKSLQQKYEAEMTEKCKEIFCVARYACNENLKPRCIEGKCTLA